MELDKDRLQSAIVTAAANQLLENSEDLSWLVKKLVEARIDKIFADSASALIKASIDRAVEAGFEREYRRVDSFGIQKGETTTIRRELEASITGYWTTKVDTSGSPTSSSYNSLTRAEWIMTKAVGEDFVKMVRQNAVNVTGALKDAMRGELRKNLDAVLGELFRVKSADDKAEGRSV